MATKTTTDATFEADVLRSEAGARRLLDGVVRPCRAVAPFSTRLRRHMPTRSTS